MQAEFSAFYGREKEMAVLKRESEEAMKKLEMEISANERNQLINQGEWMSLDETLAVVLPEA